LEVGDARFWVKVVVDAEPAGAPEQPSSEEGEREQEAFGEEEGQAAVLEEPVQREAPPEHQVRSPMNGVFYGAPAPGADPYVTVGDFVEAGQVVCLIEAMKTFNEVTAEWAGKVVAILVENEQQVKEGEGLMVVEPEEERE